MTPEKAFLQAIIDNPDDDAPRLIYADWLEEHGDGPRAEFIRLQCQLARMDRSNPGRPALHSRAAALEEVHAASWQPEVPTEVRYPLACFRRGFVTLLMRPIEDWLASPGRYDGVTPVEELYLPPPTPRIAELAEEPHLSRLRGLRLNLDEQGAMALSTSRHLGRIECLNVSPTRLGVGGAVAFARAEMPNLTTFKALNFQLGVDGVRALLMAPGLPRLRQLDLSCNLLGTEGAEQLASVPQLAKLNSLDLGANSLGPSGVSALARSPYVAGLRKLCLSSNRAGDEGALALARSPHLAELWSLGLFRNGLTFVGARALATSPYLGKVSGLDLKDNPLGVDGVHALAASTTLTRLVGLHLEETQMGDAGIAALASSPVLTYVAELGLDSNGITEKGAQALAQSPYLRNLNWLSLQDNRIGSKGAVALAASPILERLSWLDLSGNHIGSLGAKALARSPYLRNLNDLKLDNNQITVAGAKALAGSLFLPQPPYFGIWGLASNRLGDVGRQALRDRWGGGAR